MAWVALRNSCRAGARCSPSTSSSARMVFLRSPVSVVVPSYLTVWPATVVESPTSNVAVRVWE